MYYKHRAPNGAFHSANDELVTSDYAEMLTLVPVASLAFLSSFFKNSALRLMIFPASLTVSRSLDGTPRI